MDPLTISAIGLGANLLEGAVNFGQQQSNNKFQKEAFYQSREWALEDWNRNNTYNSPASQMQRYKDAGLNPNLIYGQSNTAAPVRSTDAPKTQAPQINVAQSMLQGFMSMYDLQKTQAETNRIEKQALLLDAERRLKETMITGGGLKNEYLGNQLTYQSDYLAGRNKLLAQDLEKRKADTQFTLNQDARNTLLTSNTMSQGIEKILTMQAQRATMGVQRQVMQQQIENLKKDGTLKQLDINLQRLGIQKSDPAWSRIASQIIANPGKAAQVIQNLGEATSPDMFRPLYAKPGGWNKK